MLPNKFRNIFAAETTFPSLPTCFQMFPTRETLFFRLGHVQTMFKGYSANINNTKYKTSTGNNVSATMFPSLPSA